MNRRLMSLAPLAPAAAIIAFAAAGAAAQGFAAARANAIEDVQIGESGNLLRVALICKADCRVGARSSGVFYLPGLRSSLNIDLARRSANADGLVFAPVEGGSTLTIRADAPIVTASIKPCVIDAAPASCIDLEFAPPETKLAAVETPAAPSRKPARAGSRQAKAETPASAARTAPRETPKPPPLREAPAEEKLVFASLAAPERFAPPAASTAAPSIRDGQSRARRPIIDREKAAALIGEDFDIAAAAADILGRSYSPDDCSGAEARLRADAWALDAMVDVGFCEAIAGDLESGDEVFIRLLEFTPDNYEALVGRALIAAKAGEKSVARKYFQDALNAPPPMAESERIVKAMAEL